MKIITVNEIEYELIENYKNSFNQEEFLNLVTDYFDEYDYILGDYSYDKLRLKGFCNKNNKNLRDINDYEHIKEHIKDYCSYGCGYYILEKKAKNN